MTELTRPRRWRCCECGDICDDAVLLTAPSPFDPDRTISGCPHCLEAETLEAACDVKGCWMRGSVGTPTPQGYRWTCHEHAPGGG